MRTLAVREKRLLLFGSIGIGIYLLLYVGLKPLQTRRADYQRLVTEANNLSAQVKPYESRVQVIKKMMEDFRMDPTKLSKATVVGEASSAIQKAAQGSGFVVGPVREPPARSTAKELALQLEGSGPLPAVMGMLQRLKSLGYPLIVDSVQITVDNARPGQVKMNLTIVILDFEQWKLTEAPHA